MPKSSGSFFVYSGADFDCTENGTVVCDILTIEENTSIYVV